VIKTLLICESRARPFRHDTDLEQAWPQFAGHEQALVDGVVRDPVQHVFGPVAIHRAENAA
jgi:hypothetical protein